jgi:hypothetical protein
MPPRNDEFDWIFDLLLQFLESERFDAAVMDFIDEKCHFFENEDENCFEYTDIHRDFSEHVDTLITTNLGEWGITSEMFLEALENGRNARDVNRAVYERMLAMEDFETFKKLMVKRNMELQLETIRAYSVVKGTPSSRREGKGESKGGDERYDDEEKEYAAALEASLKQPMSPLPVPEELKALLEAEDKGRAADDEAEVQETLRRSLMEMEVLHRQEELEQAELEAAVAMSLALEEERARLAREQQQREEKLALELAEAAAEAEAAAAAAAAAAAQLAESKEAKHADDTPVKPSAPSPSAAAYLEEKHADSPFVTRAADVAVSSEAKGASPVAPSPATVAAARSSKDEEPVVAVDPAPAQETSADAEADEKEQVKEHLFMDDGASARRAKAALKPVGAKLSADTFAAPKPLQGRGLGGFSALPSIAAVNESRLRAEAEMKRAQGQLAQGRQQEEELRKRVEMDPAEAERRAKHMAEQRDRLLAMKKAEREKRVRAEEEERRQEGDAVPAAALRAMAEAQARARDGKDADAEETALEAEKRRAATRLALARRMKLDLIVSEEMKLAQMEQAEFADLDRKLRQVEQLRKENELRERVLAEQLKRQQATIAKHIQSAAVDMVQD